MSSFAAWCSLLPAIYSQRLPPPRIDLGWITLSLIRRARIFMLTLLRSSGRDPSPVDDVVYFDLVLPKIIHHQRERSSTECFGTRPRTACVLLHDFPTVRIVMHSKLVLSYGIKWLCILCSLILRIPWPTAVGWPPAACSYSRVFLPSLPTPRTHYCTTGLTWPCHNCLGT